MAKRKRGLYGCPLKLRANLTGAAALLRGAGVYIFIFFAMKTIWLPLSLRFARASLRPALLFVPLVAGAALVRAQDAPRIVFPQEGQDVRGEISARFEGVPAGGYAIIKIARQGAPLVFKTATSQGNYVLDTIADSTTFSGDGAYTLEITALNAGGRKVGTSSVTFNVANNKVAGDSESTLLVHWIPQDRLNDGVQRYRVYAESNADITEPESGGSGGGSGGGGMGGGGGGGSDSGEEFIEAPLDWQVSVLLRREVRDVNGFQGAANIATLVSEAWQHQRLSEESDSAEGGSGSGGGGKSKKKKGSAKSAPVKAPWSPDWNQGPEFAKFYVKAIQQTGDEINATRKRNTIAIADLLPTFPTVAVRPGSTWNSRQSILSDLSTRSPINIEGAITFTAYENIQTPGGVSRRCAKIESRFPLPEGVSKRIAADLGNKIGTSGAGGAGSGSGSPSGGKSLGRGASSGGDASGEDKLSPEDILVAQFNMARVIWFDMDKHQVVRSEDTLRAYFEIPPTETDAGGSSGSSSGGRGGSSRSSSGIGSGGGEADAEPEEPTKVNYSMNITTWLDDRIPGPSVRYTGGGGTAHARDNATEPGLGRATGR